MNDHSFVGRFRLTSLAASKSFVGNVMKPSVLVDMAAVKDGDEEDCLFGQYTPNGTVKMTVANPPVAAALAQDWHDWIEAEEPPGDYSTAYQNQPVYEVTFRRIR